MELEVGVEKLTEGGERSQRGLRQYSPRTRKKNKREAKYIFTKETWQERKQKLKPM